MSSSFSWLKEFSDEEGRIILEDERMIVTSSIIFGILRKDLIENISKERMKGFLTRYGWNLGKSDAKKAMRKQYTTLEELLSQGPQMHLLRGFTRAQRTKLNIGYSNDFNVETIHVEGRWIASYEAEEHVTQFGLADLPVCYTLIGYASGYYSTICNKKVLFKEVNCIAKGDRECTYIGKTLEQWGDAILNELPYFEEETIVQELHSTYDQLLDERNYLSKAISIHNRLTNELVIEGELQSIANIVYEELNLPMIIEDNFGNILKTAGVSTTFMKSDYLEISKDLHERQSRFGLSNQVIKVKGEFFYCLCIPIIIKQQSYGNCLLIYENGQDISKIDQMILENAATVCSIYLLNEKNTFEASERVKGYFLNQILDCNYSNEHEIIQKGNFIQMNLKLPYYIIVLSFRSKQYDIEEELILTEQILEEVIQFTKAINNILIGKREDKIVLFIQENPITVLKSQCNKLLNYLTKHFSNHYFFMGISSKGVNLDRAYIHLDEAMLSSQITNLNEPLVLFDELGIVGLMLHSNNKDMIKIKAKQMLGQLVHKNKLKSELLYTLYIFLQNGGNLENTRMQLSLSMSGLRYRLEKIELLVGHDIRDPNINYQLLLSLQVLMASGDLSI
ncbi:XylR N-terminal domain-containing protein [Rummeliibacillus pycnus]|uniref:XylR N-terminal domain-containing protein n=1 Tax=Rummeliibacillus pycnus TaxID=101070 RepID=UPI000C9C66CC|nr:XylR N-terminal domain-containing protein [Rummeliibacillus pycnus]